MTVTKRTALNTYMESSNEQAVNELSGNTLFLFIQLLHYLIKFWRKKLCLIIYKTI